MPVNDPQEPPASIMPTPAPSVETLYLEVNFTAESCEPRPWGVACNQEGKVISSNGTFLEFSMEVECQPREGETVKEIRNGVDCSCAIELLNETNRKCRCIVCPEGFGDSPVAIECTDGFLIDECSRVDCNLECDGTCVKDCKDSGPECPLCDRDLIRVVDLMPSCTTSNTFDQIMDCLQTATDPTCFTDATTDNVTSCVFPFWYIDPLRDTPLVSDGVGECFEDVIICINGKIDNVFADQPNCAKESSLALSQCLLDNAESCASTCASCNWTYAFQELVNEDFETCSNVSENLMDPMCELISCCPACLNELDALATCTAEDVLGLNTTCNLSCNAGGGSRRLYAVTDFILSRSAEVAFSRCTPFDPDTANASFWLGYVDCVIKETLGFYDDFLQTSSPTEQPTQAPTEIPSIQPSLGPSSPDPPPTPTPETTPVPTQEAKLYFYTDLTIRLEGANKELSVSSKAAFEEATEEFYRTLITLGTDQRRLQGVDMFEAFLTEVTATAGALDTQGLTVTYDQDVSYRLTSSDFSETQTLDFLLNSLEDGDNKKLYVAVLRKKDQDFQSVTTVATGARAGDTDDEDDDGLSITVIVILLLVACLVPCCCAIIYFYRKRRSSRGEKLVELGQNSATAYQGPEPGIGHYGEQGFADEGVYEQGYYGGQPDQYNDDGQYDGGPDRFSDDGEVFGYQRDAFVDEFEQGGGEHEGCGQNSFSADSESDEEESSVENEYVSESSDDDGETEDSSAYDLD